MILCLLVLMFSMHIYQPLQNSEKKSLNTAKCKNNLHLLRPITIEGLPDSSKYFWTIFI